jgi:putative component of toxin-antitoxin plasmid stabilization module
VDELSDFKAAALDAAVVRVLCALGIDLAKTEWLKALGDGLFEFRIRHTAEEIVARFGDESPMDRSGAPESVLLRVFVHFYGQKVVLLLGGYDKGRAPSPKRQQAEIKQARKLLAQFKERQRRGRG